MGKGEGKGKLDGGVGGLCGETLGFGAICYNILYSFSLLVVVITGCVGLGTYQWMSNTSVSHTLWNCFLFCA
jgi:hypothetical protein